ncbi:MAG: carboxypeptidase regulatory-like domain-containing protein [Planctomycetes bacterium]|nr:carboxypeptidase regulatory-like domain-containing protein [Planctomycetota bacterium]
MKRLLLPLFLLIVLFAGLGGGIWLLASHGPESAPERITPQQEDSRTAADREVALEGPSADGAQSASARSAEMLAQPASKLRGTIRIPAGIQEPGPIHVYALDERAIYRDLVRRLARDAKRTKPEDDTRSFLASCDAAPDGSFELQLLEGTTRAHLLAQGRFVYVERSLDVDLRRRAPLELVTKAGACIQGTVKLPESEVIGTLDDLHIGLGPVVRGSMAMNPERPPEFETTASTGSFELRAVPVEVAYRLTGNSDLYAYVELPVEHMTAGQTLAVELALEPGGTLRGVVQASDGKPLEGAQVKAARAGEWFGVDDHEVRSAKTDSAGAFELAHVPAGALKLQASATGYLQSEKLDIDLRAGVVTEGALLVLREGQSVSGVVRFADGKPASGAEVRLSFDLSQMSGMSAFNALEGAEGKDTADAQGQFVIRGLGKGPFTVRASSLPAGTAPTDEKQKEELKWRARADGVTPGTSNLELLLRAGEGLRGVVLDIEQKPVAKFKLHAQHEGKGALGAIGQDTQERSVDDAQGRFAIAGLSLGPWKVWVEAEGFASSEPVSVTLPRAPAEPELSITLERSALVSGHVLDSHGSPVAAAKVGPETKGANWQRMLSGAPPPPEALTGPDGSFRLDGLRPGAVMLIASAPEHARSPAVPVALSAGVESKGVTLTLLDGGSISGEIFDDQGKPLAGMFVQATEMAHYDVHMDNSSGEGRFRMEHLEPGTYQVVAFPGKALSGANSDQGAAFMSSMKMSSCEVREGEDTHVVLGAPPSDPVFVVGRVTHAGAPYTGALVSFVREGKDVIGHMKNVSLDAQGGFEVRLDEAGRYAVSVQRISGGMGQQQTVEFVREIPQEKRYELTLEMPTGRISGTVYDPEGKPAKGERVSLNPRSALIGGTIWGGMYVDTLTDGEGKYDLESLRPGEYILGAGGMSMGGIFGSNAAHGRELRSDLRLSEGDWQRNIDFHLKQPATVDVLVVGEDGQPIAKAAVFARDANGTLLDRLSLVSADESGLAHYGGLAPGEYSFSSRMDVRASAEGANVKLAEGETKNVKLVLQSGTTLLVQTVDSEGKNVQAALSVLDSRGHESSGMFGLAEIMEQFTKNGLDFTTQRVGPLPPGKYTVTARTSDGKNGSKPVSLTGQPERKLTIRVE